MCHSYQKNLIKKNFFSFNFLSVHFFLILVYINSFFK